MIIVHHQSAQELPFSHSSPNSIQGSLLDYWKSAFYAHPMTYVICKSGIHEEGEREKREGAKIPHFIYMLHASVDTPNYIFHLCTGITSKILGYLNEDITEC